MKIQPRRSPACNPLPCSKPHNCLVCTVLYHDFTSHYKRPQQGDRTKTNSGCYPDLLAAHTTLFPSLARLSDMSHGCHPTDGAARTHDRGPQVLGFKYFSNKQPRKMQHVQGAGAGHARLEAPQKDPVTSTCGHECLETPRWQHVLCLPSDIM